MELWLEELGQEQHGQEHLCKQHHREQQHGPQHQWNNQLGNQKRAARLGDAERAADALAAAGVPEGVAAGSAKVELDARAAAELHLVWAELPALDGKRGETVQRLYEKQKHSPPTVRNAPPVTASIMWARQLMRRIEEPMIRFQHNKNLMNTKESKKIVKTYNRIARTIVEFETLWHLAWSKSIESSKAGLQATLIIRHPSNGKLYVNFDREILQLIRETKCLIRMDIEVPESAKIVLLQEAKRKARLAIQAAQKRPVAPPPPPATPEAPPPAAAVSYTHLTLPTILLV